MSRRRIKEIVWNFPENGMKLLLEDPKNVRDLLRTGDVDVVESRKPCRRKSGCGGWNSFPTSMR
jgi:hypothetical protein